MHSSGNCQAMINYVGNHFKYTITTKASTKQQMCTTKYTLDVVISDATMENQNFLLVFKNTLGHIQV